jgi:uncharacterized protein YdcH (DUF465 family)
MSEELDDALALLQRIDSKLDRITDELDAMNRRLAGLERAIDALCGDLHGDCSPSLLRH